VTTVEHDPVDAARNLAQLDGLSALRAMIAGELPPPPIATLLGFELVEVEPGRAIFAVEPGEQHSRGQAPLHPPA
jgi:acyl-coenzyme A thioesterase PaaI-like protein